MIKKKSLRVLALLGVIMTATSTTIQVTTTVRAETKFTKNYNKISKINRNLTQKLYVRQHSDEKDSNDWSKFVKNVKFLRNNQVEVYVNPNFKKLKTTQRQDVVNQAQLFTLRIADDVKNFDGSAYVDGLASIIFCDGSYLGRSNYLDNKNFNWNK